MRFRLHDSMTYMDTSSVYSGASFYFEDPTFHSANQSFPSSDEESFATAVENDFEEDCLFDFSYHSFDTHLLPVAVSLSPSPPPPPALRRSSRVRKKPVLFMDEYEKYY